MSEIKPNPEQELDEMAAFMVRERGVDGAISLCKSMMLERQKGIDGVDYYDAEEVSALQNSIMDLSAVLIRIKKMYQAKTV